MTRTPMIVLTIWMALTSAAQAADAIPFPKDFREWAHVKSVLVGPKSTAFATEGGIHHIYANDKALEGYRTGKFPDGSIVVYDLLDIKEVDGNTIEGQDRRIDVMAKDSTRHDQTGGWDFARFWGDKRTDGTLAPDAKAACFKCHDKRKDHDFVFSAFRE